MTVETIVSRPWAGPTRLPTCALASPAMPLMGEVILVKPRLRAAFSTAAFAAITAAFEERCANLAWDRSGRLLSPKKILSDYDFPANRVNSD